MTENYFSLQRAASAAESSTKGYDDTDPRSVAGAQAMKLASRYLLHAASTVETRVVLKKPQKRKIIPFKSE